MADEYNIIKSSKLFNEQWYKENYLKDNSKDPIKHYLDEGWKNNLNPSPEFNTKWYLEKNPDVKKAGINPLVHYIQYGRKEGRLPYETFDSTLKEPYDIVSFSELFDRKWFAKYYSLENTNVDLVKYYLDYYLIYGLNPSPNFDSIWYLDTYPDVKKAGMNPLVHYIKYGKKEGRQPKLK